jgi:hypothetical protein
MPVLASRRTPENPIALTNKFFIDPSRSSWEEIAWLFSDPTIFSGWIFSAELSDF